MDGFAGARTDLSAAPSVDIANGAPTGGGATNQIVDVWADGGSNINDNKACCRGRGTAEPRGATR